MSGPICRSVFPVLAALASAALTGGAVSSAPAQTILLPTRVVSGVNTVVSVPDRGWGRLGGISRYSSSRFSRGIPGLPSNPFTSSRAIGSQSGSSQFVTNVQILDMSELEAGHMAGYQPPAAVVSESVRVEPEAAVRRKADFISRNLGRSKNR